MSSSEFSKCAIESNIPVPKRSFSAAKRSKNCAQLPELQKYIETIIRASNEREDGSEKGKKMSRERKHGKYSVCRGTDKTSKQEITKVDCQMSGLKSKYKARAPLAEAVSNGDEISCMFVSRFDDPRNWKTDETRNPVSRPAVESCLERLFPNPYRLANGSDLLSAVSPQKGDKGEKAEETLPGIPRRCNAFTQTEVQSGKADDDLVAADIEIEPRERASNVTCTLSSATDVENVPRPVSRKGGRRAGNPPTAPRNTPTKTPKRLRSNSTINISSRASSLDSVSDVFSSYTRTMTPKHKNSKSTLHSGKSSTNEPKSKSSVEDFLDDLSSDYDLGKLRLLSMSDSDDSFGRTCDDSTTNGMCEADDMKDLREIFDVMDKATESFFEMSMKNGTNSYAGRSEARNKKVLQLLDQLIGEKPQVEPKQSQGVVLEEIKEETSEKEETKPKTTEVELTKKEDNLTTPEDHPEDKEESKSIPKVDPNSGEEANSSKEENGEKVDEVLQFMYDCLKKFSNHEKKQPEEFPLEENKKQVEQESPAKKPRKPPSDSSTPDGSSESLSVKNYPRVKEIQSESFTFLGESKRKLSRHRSRLKHDKTCPTGATRSTAGRPPTAARSLDMNSRADSVGTTSENRLQTVESQNELGSYSEQAQVPPDWYPAKPILPHSVRPKKSKTDTQKSIKDALENEEKLLANYLNSKPKTLEKTGESKSRKLVVRNGRTGSGYPLLNDFKRTNSSFVICVSSLPRNLRTMAANKTSLTLSPSLSLSLSDISRNWSLKPLSYYATMSLKKVPVILDIPRSALELSYNKSEGTVVMMEAGLLKHIARPVCLKQTVSCSTVRDEVSLKRSECSMNVRMRPMKKSLFVESSPEEGVMGEASLGGSHRVESILEALEKTEGRLLMLEQNGLIHSESSSTSGGNDKCDRLEWESDTGQEKVHELLLRTYNLQQKLHLYLHKMSVVPPVCPLMRERCPATKEQTPEDLPSRTDEGTTVEIEKSDHATSYNPPSEGNPTAGKTDENEDDDSSSVCSFKSSNEFSEPNETPKPSENTRSGDFLKKIFNEIDTFRQNFTPDKKEAQSTVGSNQENSEENRLTEYDPKTPAKVLKTVFKGKKSTTELTIGLKDVPMTKVSNISVEKRKFSPNHTKISICILKEKPEASEKSNSVQETLKPDGSTLHSKLSSLYFDRIRPSVSRCRTEYSRVEDDLSKTSATNSTNDSDDDDDYKSVASSFSTSDVVADKKEVPDDSRQPATPPPPPKTFTKYRFDFYRKMDLSLDQTKPKPLSNTLCRYKELQPLKEALTEMQIRMRSIKQDTYISNDYYERALKLAKMSAGYCQSCGNRAVIPKDPFGYYKTLLPRRCSSHRQGRHVKVGGTPPPSFYSFRSSNPEMSESFCELDVNHSSPYLMNHTRRSSGAYLRSSLHNMPILIGRM